jgi:RNA polymerase primary sigma factor
MARRNIEFVPHPRFESPDAQAFVDSLRPPTLCQSSTVEKTEVAPAGDLRTLFADPLLTPEEERFLFCQMNFLKYEASRLPMRAVNRIDRLLADALAIRNHIVKSNVRLIAPLAKRFTEPRVTFEQLVSEGYLPLLRAVELFDFSRGYLFSTYATWAIRNQLLRCRERNARDRSRFVFKSALLDEAVEHSSGGDDAERLANRRRRLTGRLLDQLADRDRIIVAARFGLDDSGRAHSFSEIGRLLGLSKERARQLTYRAVAQLQQVRLPEVMSA